MRNTAIALALVTLAAPSAGAEDIRAFVATGQCNELKQIEDARGAIIADPSAGLAGKLRALRINSRQFLDTLDACEADAGSGESDE